MMDRRYLYLLRQNRRGEIVVELAVRVNFARRKEARLHRMFSASRYVKGRGARTWGQAACKIGIASTMSSRISSIRSNPNGSGKTEWFALNPLERWAVRCWMRWFALRWWALVSGVLVSAAWVALYCLA